MATRYYPLSFSITLLINQGAGINVTDTWTSTQRGPLLSVVTLFFRGSTAKINLWDKLCLDFVFSFTSRRTAVDTARGQEKTCFVIFLPGILDCFVPEAHQNAVTRGERAAWAMADYVCSFGSLSTLFTGTLRGCLTLQICLILSHSRYSGSYLIATHPSTRHPSHLLISTTCLRCPHIIFPSHTGCRLNLSIIHPWTYPFASPSSWQCFGLSSSKREHRYFRN